MTKTVPAQQEILAELRQLLGDVLSADVSAVRDDLPLLDLITSSLAMVDGMRHVYERYQVMISLREVIEAQASLGALAYLIEAELKKRAAGEAKPGQAAAPELPKLPLWPGQQHPAFLLRYAANGGAAYNVALRLDWTGELDIATLEAALTTLLVAHEGLRLALSPAEDAFELQTLPKAVLRRTKVNPAMLEALVAEIINQPFAPGELLLRVELLNHRPDEAVLLLVSHSLVQDRASLRHLAHALVGQYSDSSQRTDTTLLPWQDVARLAFAEPQTEARAAAQRYWRSQLQPVPARLELPSDFARPAVKMYEGARQSRGVSAELWTGLNRLAAAHNCESAAVLEAAFALWLHRLSGQNELLLGFASGPRFGLTAEAALATTTDMVGLVSHYRPEQSFSDWLPTVTERLRASRRHNALAAGDLIPLLGRERDQSRSAPFSAALRLEKASVWPQTTDFKIGEGALPVAVARYDLELISHLGDDAAVLHCDFSTELFRPETIAIWLDGFLAMLESAVIDPATPCRRLPMMAATTRQRIIHDWNATEVARAIGDTAVELIAASCQRFRANTAVRCAGESYSYEELWARSGQIAGALTAQGVTKGDRVAINMPRSLDLVPVLLAVWRLGGAYVPLDPAFPAERRQYMMADARVKAVVTTRKFAGTTTGPVPLLLDELPVIQAKHDFWPAVAPGQTAYIMYTSGSTGRPKGVEVSHANLSNYLLAVNELWELKPEHRFLALTTIAFDISLTELFAPLLAGAVVDVAPDGLAADGLALKALLAERRPSHVQTTPSTWKLLMATGWSSGPDLTMISIGEKLERGLAEALLRDNRVLWNLYGPTETTIGSTCGAVVAGANEAVTIGRPLANTQIYLLDEAGQPVPPGVVGELCIGGLGVAKGYWGQPELTAGSFVPNPFRPGEVIYRTGDLARYRPDGEIICLGRRDHQLKIHGVRVEPGEIEAVLQALPEVVDAVVTGWLDNSDAWQLVAHIVPAGVEVTATALRELLRTRLPSVMVPPYILFAEQLPLTGSGKVDRAALPAPLHPAGGQDIARVAPQTPTEQLLAEAWAAVLDIDVQAIDRDAHFFDLGGHSLAMTPMMLAVRERFHIELRLHEFFKALTLRAFAALIDERRRQRNAKGAGPAPAETRRAAGYAKERMAYLRAEAALPATIVPARGQFYRPAGPYRHVLMTGATGFLGVYLVAEILQKTEATLYCLVRPKQGIDGKARIEAQMRHYDVWQSNPEWSQVWIDRVKIVEGDVTLPMLGMTEGQYDRLCRQIDAILHSAAHVNFIYPYEALRATNVLGLHEIIRFAFRGRIKPVHHLSTAAIWPMGSEFTFYEKDPIEHNQLLNLGYDEAKWVGEQVLLNAAERGLPVVRYRPGEVGGDSVTGRCVTDHFIFACIKGFLQFGAFPALDIEVDIAPVDYVAQALVFLMFERNSLGRAFHLTNPSRRHMSDALTYLRSLGYRFDEMGFEQLRDGLVRRPNFIDNALFPYQSVLEEMDEVSLQLPTYDTRQADRYLRGSDIRCAPADEKLFATYIGYLRRIGYLPEPEIQVHSLNGITRRS